MPTKHRRVSVTVDPELSAAVARARNGLGHEIPDGTLIHDLAVRGSEALGTDEQERKRRLEALAKPGFVGELLDPEGLAEVLAQREQHVIAP